jgi:hypothetical protein
VKATSSDAASGRSTCTCQPAAVVRSTTTNSVPSPRTSIEPPSVRMTASRSDVVLLDDAELELLPDWDDWDDWLMCVEVLE